MTVSALVQALNLTVHAAAGGAMARPVTGGYAGDLLSWVMGRAPGGAAWVTIMSNVNAAAVAVMADLSCVILAEGVVPDAALRDRALRENLGLLGSPLGAYELCHKIYDALSDRGGTP
jgi:hypothetical protein